MWGDSRDSGVGRRGPALSGAGRQAPSLSKGPVVEWDTGRYQALEGGALAMSCGSEQREPGATANLMDTQKLRFRPVMLPRGRGRTQATVCFHLSIS